MNSAKYRSQVPTPKQIRTDYPPASGFWGQESESAGVVCLPLGPRTVFRGGLEIGAIARMMRHARQRNLGPRAYLGYKWAASPRLERFSFQPFPPHPGAAKTTRSPPILTTTHTTPPPAGPRNRRNLSPHTHNGTPQEVRRESKRARGRSDQSRRLHPYQRFGNDSLPTKRSSPLQPPNLARCLQQQGASLALDHNSIPLCPHPITPFIFLSMHVYTYYVFVLDVYSAMRPSH